MAMLDEALMRLRRHTADMHSLAAELRQADPMHVQFADRLDKAANNAAEDVEILQILAYTTQSVVPAAVPAPAVVPPACHAAAPRAEATSTSMLEESIAGHDRDHAQERDGIPAHRAGEMPDQCGACAVFAVMLTPPTTIVY